MAPGLLVNLSLEWEVLVSALPADGRLTSELIQALSIVAADLWGKSSGTVALYIG